MNIDDKIDSFFKEMYKLDKEKNLTNAFICYIASFNILKYWVFITWKM